MYRWNQVEAWLRPVRPTMGAEIGVKSGQFITHLLRNFPDLTMYAVDPWEDQPGKNEDYIGWDWDDIYGQYMKNTGQYRSRVIELREYSISAADNVKDGSLDFVFIDAQHDYESVRNDIEIWSPKIKKGGLISGHDYEPRFDGVIRAVDKAYGKPMVGANYVWGVWC